MHDKPGDAGFDVLTLLPRLTMLGNVLNRSRLVERAMDRAGIVLDRPALSVLLVLRLAGQPLRVGEIAKRMDVVGPHATRQTNLLERRGLARRVVDPDDQRARLIEPTAKGTRGGRGLPAGRARLALRRARRLVRGRPMDVRPSARAIRRQPCRPASAAGRGAAGRTVKPAEIGVANLGGQSLAMSRCR